MRERPNRLVSALAALGLVALAACSPVADASEVPFGTEGQKAGVELTDEEIIALVGPSLVAIGNRGCNGVLVYDGDETKVTAATVAHCVDEIQNMSVAIPPVWGEQGVVRHPQFVVLEKVGGNVMSNPSLGTVEAARARGLTGLLDFYPDGAILIYEGKVNDGLLVDESPLQPGERVVLVAIPPEQINTYMDRQSPEPNPVVVEMIVVGDDGTCGSGRLLPERVDVLEKGMSGSPLIGIEDGGVKLRGLFRGFGDVYACGADASVLKELMGK